MQRGEHLPPPFSQAQDERALQNTVKRLTPKLRDRRAGYERSLRVLTRFKELAPDRVLKSSLILGLGERRREVLAALRDLRTAGVDAITLGQYLRPTPRAAPIVRYLAPEEFAGLAQEAKEIGFPYVASGPLVRSSYRAASLLER